MAAPEGVNRLAAALRQVATHLEDLERGWALVGGLAVSARAEPRFTRDLDIAVAVAGDPEAEALVHALQERGYAVLASLEQEATGRLATVRLHPPGEPDPGLVVDLLFASSGIEPEVVAAAEAVEILAGIRVPIARAGHLLALKVLSRAEGRPQDAADIHALLAAADTVELARAREAVALIAARGFHRNKDLAGELERLIDPRP